MATRTGCLFVVMFAAIALRASSETISQNEGGEKYEATVADKTKEKASQVTDSLKDGVEVVSGWVHWAGTTKEDATKPTQESSGSYFVWAVEKVKNMAGTAHQMGKVQYSNVVDATPEVAPEDEKKSGDISETLSATKGEFVKKTSDAAETSKDYSSKAGEQLSAAKDKVTDSISGVYASAKDMVSEKWSAAKTASDETSEQAKGHYETSKGKLSQTTSDIGLKIKQAVGTEDSHEEL